MQITHFQPNLNATLHNPVIKNKCIVVFKFLEMYRSEHNELYQSTVHTAMIHKLKENKKVDSDIA